MLTAYVDPSSVRLNVLLGRVRIRILHFCPRSPVPDDCLWFRRFSATQHTLLQPNAVSGTGDENSLAYPAEPDRPLCGNPRIDARSHYADRSVEKTLAPETVNVFGKIEVRRSVYCCSSRLSRHYRTLFVSRPHTDANRRCSSLTKTACTKVEHGCINAVRSSS